MNYLLMVNNRNTGKSYLGHCELHNKKTKDIDSGCLSGIFEISKCVVNPDLLRCGLCSFFLPHKKELRHNL